MEFECQEGVEVENDLSNTGENSYEQRTEFDLLASEFRIGNASVKIQSKNLCCQHKKGTLVPSGSKKLLSKKDFCTCQRSIVDLPHALISEILSCLDPKDLSIVSCVSTSLQRLASEHHAWKDFYCERWGLPVVFRARGLGSFDERTWKKLFVERDCRTKTFLGRYSLDTLYGHTEAVRTVFLLDSANLIFTSGYDSIVRIWDMEKGLSIASSKPLGCTIRTIVADTKLLVAGGTDGFIHCWKSLDGLQHLFDVAGSQLEKTELRLWEHEGPITSLALYVNNIFSGSWDMSVRIWDRSLMSCIKTLRHSDWVWNLAPRGPSIASTSGSDIYIWEISTRTPLAIIHDTHEGNTYSLARSHIGDYLFIGGEDGEIKMFGIKRRNSETSVKLLSQWVPHDGPVYSLAFEFPWLVSAAGDGKLALIDVRKLLSTNHRTLSKKVLKDSNHCDSSIEPPQRMLHGFGSNLFSVDLGSDYIVCGGEEGTVRIWYFTQALEREQRARAFKSVRLENRMRRRRLQMEMNSKNGRPDQCLIAAHKNPLNGDRNQAWHSKRGASGKVKA